MLLPWKNVCIMVLVQLFSSFGRLNGIELPLELLHKGASGGKSVDFARRMAFPLPKHDNGVEVPPNIEDSMELNDPQDFAATVIEAVEDMEDRVPTKTEMPKWLQMQQAPETHQQVKYHPSSMLPKHTQADKHQHDSRLIYSSSSSTAAVSPLRRCAIEISNKIPGICQVMGSIGNACVSGDYIDVFNAECL